MESASGLSRAFRHAAPAKVAACMVALLAVAAGITPAARAASDEVVRAPSGVMYVTGGAGTEAVEHLKSMEKDFNLKLVFANTSGEYLSDVKVRIVDTSGHVVLDAVSEGPLLMAKLPAGGYQIDATFGGRSETRKIAVSANKLITADFRWAAS